MKTNLKKTLFIAVFALLFSGCFRNDIRTVTFHIEQMRTEESGRLIRQAINGLDGIESAVADLNDQTLTVVFNGRTLYLKNIEYAIVKSGFSLPNWPASSADKADLPEELR